MILILPMGQFLTEHQIRKLSQRNIKAIRWYALALTTNLCTKSVGDEYFGSYAQLKSNLVQGTRTATATWRRNARNIYKYWFVTAGIG